MHSRPCGVLIKSLSRHVCQNAHNTPCTRVKSSSWRFVSEEITRKCRWVLFPLLYEKYRVTEQSLNTRYLTWCNQCHVTLAPPCITRTYDILCSYRHHVHVYLSFHAGNEISWSPPEHTQNSFPFYSLNALLQQSANMKRLSPLFQLNCALYSPTPRHLL